MGKRVKEDKNKCLLLNISELSGGWLKSITVQGFTNSSFVKGLFFLVQKISFN